MFLFIGLGNPGEKFAGTRHNIGREILMAAAKKFGVGQFALRPKLQSLAAEGKTGQEKMAFILPETFMNKSGAAVAASTRFFRTKPESLIVIHDDADMLLGAAKLSFGKNSGGHKGVESVMRALATKNFWRMRIGIQKKRRVPGENLVLQKFSPGERVAVKKISAKSLRAIKEIVARGPARAMNSYNA